MSSAGRKSVVLCCWSVVCGLVFCATGRGPVFVLCVCAYEPVGVVKLFHVS